MSSMLFLVKDMELLELDDGELDRVDQLFFKNVNIKTFPELAQILIIIHTLNHGEADMESEVFIAYKHEGSLHNKSRNDKRLCEEN